jgi:hypothetical protein
MAKQHRMFVLTLAALIAAIELQVSPAHRGLWGGLAIIVAGSAITVWRRTVRLLREAKAR